MAEEYQDIEVWQDSDWRRIYTVTESGSVKDITGASCYLVVARQLGESAAATEGTTGVSVTVTDGAAGEVTMTWTAAATSELAGDYEYILYVEDATGKKVPVALGSLVVNEV
ncbi:MAG: hypothetical protein R3324_13095 [Halobacteriales archaeon]|nr:hypothetical protein [Halobacteriales archaeon]